MPTPKFDDPTVLARLRRLAAVRRPLMADGWHGWHGCRYPRFFNAANLQCFEIHPIWIHVKKKKPPIAIHATHAIHRLNRARPRRAEREKPLDEPWITAYFEDFPLRAGPRVVV
jgi:hypothetical protein